MLHSRAAIYFDEVARRGSIRRAADHLHIAASAIDRQLLRLEEQVGAPLFERSPNGMRLTAAGELLVDAVRRARRDGDRVTSLIDDLQGLRRGQVTIALAEDAAALIGRTLAAFRDRYGAISCSLVQASATTVVDLVLSSECDLGITFNPPSLQGLRIEQTVAYRLGLVVRRDHRFADQAEVSLRDCAEEAMIMPDTSLSLRAVVNQAWLRTLGELPRNVYFANSIALMKALVESGAGIALLTQTGVLLEGKSSELVFVGLKDYKIPLSIMALISQSARLLSVPAAMLQRSIMQEMSVLAPLEGLPAG